MVCGHYFESTAIGPFNLGTGNLDGSGVASLSKSDLAVGDHAITAVYGATTDFTSSTSPTVHQIVNSNSSTALERCVSGLCCVSPSKRGR